MKKRLLKLKYTIIFFIVIQLILIVVISIKELKDKEIFLENKTQLSKVEYEAIYWKIKEQSEMIFQGHINNKEIIDIFKNAHSSNDEEKVKLREKLYKKLSSRYNRLKSLINLRQLHFHLPNNHSFLRMHRPKKFGDDLSSIRETVAYVNRYKKPIDGFEEGRIYNGFRFVYPLFDENKKYIGSIEVSFSTSSFQNTLSNNIRFSQFIFLKKTVDDKVWKDEYESNYIQTKISPLFVRESHNKNDKHLQSKQKIKSNFTPKLLAKFENNILSQEAYSLAINIENKTKILSFLPIKNPINKKLTAYFVIISQTNYLTRLHFENNLLKLISFALLFSIFIIIYRKYKHDDELKEQQNIMMEQSKMAQMGSMLSNIAHQWKQPLARINSKLIEIPISLSLKDKDKKNLDKNIEDIEDLTSYMADTIENFRTYFHPDKQKNNFNIKQTINRAISLLHLNDINDNITLITDCDSDVTIDCYEDELIQVLMVLLLNAKEAIEQNDIKKPYIKILIEDKTAFIQISIIDNAGGIKENISKQIFNPYFTTKQGNKNTGVGLYMAKMIVEGSMNGQLKYKKISEESHFIITLEGLKNG